VDLLLRPIVAAQQRPVRRKPEKGNKMTASKKTIGKSEDGLHAVLPLRDIVVFPHMIVPLFVGREKSIKALEEVMGAGKANHACHADECRGR
jgi:hypothetical protein